MRHFILLFILSFALAITGIDSTTVKNPSIAWKMGLIPGMGQVYNGDYLKSGLLLSIGTYSMIQRKKYNEVNQI